jgi:hypothetical protein
MPDLLSQKTLIGQCPKTSGLGFRPSRGGRPIGGKDGILGGFSGGVVPGSRNVLMACASLAGLSQ